MSPIHDQSYRRYAGTRQKPGSAWGVIARTGLRSLVRKRFFLGVMLFSWVGFFIRAVMIYLSANFPSMDVIAPSAEMFRNFFREQGLFVFVVTVYAGAGLIATDRRVNALQIYLSKPLTRSEYIAGKLAILMVLLLLVTLVPGMLLLFLQVMFAGNFDFLREHLFLIPAMTLFGLLYSLVASFAILALSSLSTSARFVGIIYAGVILFTDAVSTVWGLVTGTRVSWISFTASLSHVGDVIFRRPTSYDTPWLVSLFVIVGLIGVCLLVLERRVRGVEVVT